MMGSRAGIAERRLRPLWDAIESRQYKTALKLASSLQAKHPESAYLLALKALVLERTGKSDEALLLCQQAREFGPVDEFTLSTLQTVYNRLQLPHETTACYEYACSKVTNNVEFSITLFKCYVKQFAYVKQQQTAMKLYKQFGEERFLLWAVCSILMQVGSENGSGTKLIALAEALLKKRIDTHDLHDLEALMLYISVLQQQEKYESALEALLGKLGGLFSIQNDKLRLQGELLMSTGKYDQAAAVFEEILKISSDDWGVFLSYLDASLGGAQASVLKTDEPACLQEDEVDKRLDKVMKLVEGLQGIQVQELRRGPFLAVVEIEKRRLILKNKCSGDKQHGDRSSSLVASILAYFERFGHMLSFSSDIASFVAYIDESQKLQVATALHETSLRMVCESPVKQLRCRISAFQVEEQLRVNLSLSNNDLIGHASQIVKLYLESLELSVELDAQESMHGEELLVLGTNLLIEVFRRTQQLGYLLEAILALEFGLFARRYSSQYKLLLINLYSILSAVSPALDWYRTLDVKYILLETLSHFMLPSMLGSTLWSDLQGLLSDALKFYSKHQTESADLLHLAYQHCTYSKVLEFVEFKERLETSHQNLVFRIEAVVLAIKLKADKLDDVEFALVDQDLGKKAIEWSSEERLQALTFNEDLQTRPWWSPAPETCYLLGSARNDSRYRSWHHVETEDERRTRESSWRFAVKRRCLLPRIIYLLHSIVKDTDSVDEFGELFEDFLKTVPLDMDDIANYFSSPASSGSVPKDSGLGPVDWITIAVFWAAYKLSTNVSESSSGVVSVVVRIMENIVDDLLRVFIGDLSEELLAGKAGNSIQVVLPGRSMSYLVGLTSESFAWLGLYLQAWSKRLQPVPKKKKKGVGSADQNDNAAPSHIPASLESIRSASIGVLEKVKTCVANHLISLEDQESEALLSLVKQESKDRAFSPGRVLNVLETGVGLATKLAARTPATKQPWGASMHIKSLVSSQRKTLFGIQDLCNLRLQVLRSLKF